MRILYFSLLVIFAIGFFTVPQAFADVTVTNAPGSSTPGCEETADGCFIPSTVTIDVGGTVTWENNDTAAHTSTAGSSTDGSSGVFDSSLIMAGSSFSHTFEEAGTFDYFCMVHPWMVGTVIVGDASADTTPPVLTMHNIHNEGIPASWTNSTSTAGLVSVPEGLGMIQSWSVLIDGLRFHLGSYDEIFTGTSDCEVFPPSAPPVMAQQVQNDGTDWYPAGGNYPYWSHGFLIGTSTVTCTATDEAGNTATESFTVTINETAADDTAPPEAEVGVEVEEEPEITPTITISTDKASYIAGVDDNVQMSGIVENSDIDDVTIAVITSNGSITGVNQVYVESDGSFSWTIGISNLNSGTYTIKPASPCQSHDCRETTFTIIQNPNAIYNAPGSSTPGCEETADGCFMPSAIAVGVGETVTWYNDDTAAHTTTSGSPTEGPDGIFDSSLVMAGSSFSHTFEDPGTYDYFCMVHPWMIGTVIVGDASEIAAFIAAQEEEEAAEAAAAAAEEAAWIEANPGVVTNAPGSSTPGCEETNSCFIPSTITVSSGQGITWYNNDTAAHTATSGTPTEGPSGAFDSSLIMAGGSYNHTFYSVGTYDYFCMVHPWMQGTVVVESASQQTEVEGESEQIEFEPPTEVIETEAEVVTESDEITTGSEITIETDIVNQQNNSQMFAYIVQIKNESGMVLSVSIISGSLGEGQTLTQAISWTPDDPGVYVAEIYLWDDMDMGNPLSGVETQYFTVT